MTELINSLKVFASGGTDAAKSQVRGSSVPLMNTVGRADSCSESGFNQWRESMRMVARLPGGLPTEFRIRLWENLADRYLLQKGLDWNRVLAKARGSPAPATPAAPTSRANRHEDIADQIDKDLHRTGCTGFSGAKQAVLKEVLLAYARWNPSVGYCQGFNMIGAMLLQMTSGDKQLTLKVFVYLIEGVLPEGYFSHGLRGLAVDMAVFRELLKLRKPSLNAHLADLQNGDDNPPLTDVFTMHWFLTLFIHCLPTPSVLRIWDLVLLEGSEVLLRAALVLWAAIETRVSSVTTADEFYSVMGVVTREMLEFGLMDPNTLVKCIVSVGPFPFPGLAELRAKHRALISQDTPYKSFFLAKRELDNLKRHYAAIRHRQRATTIILKNLEPHRPPMPNFRGNRGAPTLTLPLANKRQPPSPKPKPRRLNSAGKLVHHHQQEGHHHNRNSTKVKPRGNQNNQPTTNKQHQTTTASQVTLPWDASTKKPKNFRSATNNKQTSASSSYTSGSSSSSTELCDSSSSDSEVEGHPKSPQQVFDFSSASNKNTAVSPPKQSLDKEGNEQPVVVETPLDASRSPEDENHKQQLPAAVEPTAIEIPTIQLPTQMSVSSHASPEPTTREDGEVEEIEEEIVQPQTPKQPSIQTAQDKEEQEEDHQLNSIINGSDYDQDAKTLDTNDSQLFLEEMSRLGKSDSFYENLSHRICQLQFQNLRILTTCNTVPDPVIMPKFDYSPLPSPCSPVPPTLPVFPSGATNLTVPYTKSKLVLSPSLNHLSLSNSRRSSWSSNASSQPGSPMVPVRSPLLGSDGKRPSSKSSLSSLDDSSPHHQHNLSKMNSSSVESEIMTPSVIITEQLEETVTSTPASLRHQDAVDDHEPEEIKPSNIQEDEADQETASPQATDDINAVIRANIAILQRLKLKPTHEDDYFDDDSSSATSFVTEFSDDEPSIEGKKASQAPAAPIAPTTVSRPAARVHRSVSRTRSSGSIIRTRSNSSSKSASLQRAETVCSQCSSKNPCESRKQPLITGSSSTTSHKSAKKVFNPFPTARKARPRTSKFGLYTSAS